jgi:Flp pilus assembly protein TadG
VEFALVAPVFFLIVLACFEFARLSMLRNTAAIAACDAARRIVVPGATAEEAIDEASLLLSTVHARGATITVTPAVVDFDTKSVTVVIDIPYGRNGFLLPTFAGDKSVRCSSTQQTERYRAVSGLVGLSPEVPESSLDD